MPDSDKISPADEIEQTEPASISELEVEQMSAALVRKFGTEAMNVAAFFLDEHLEMEDQDRAESWLRVMSCLDKTYHQRLSEGLMH